MADIFLSYASEDRERVRPLVDLLERRGWSVWWDRTIPAGTSWPQMIEEELESCRVTLVVWTEASIVSEWVQIEASEARKRSKLVPVQLDDVQPPLEFRRLQAADLTAWDGVADSADTRSLTAGLEAALAGVTHAREDAASESVASPGLASKTSAESAGRSSDSTAIYDAVTRHWPKIALGVIAAIVAVGIAQPNIVTGASFQPYAFAWAISTAGLWFLFDKAEATMSVESRWQVTQWLRGSDLRGAIESIPTQFRSLFDRAFGERQLTLKCFLRSGIASVAAVLAVAGFFMVVLVPDQFDLYLGSGDAPVRLAHSVDWLALPGRGGPALAEVLFWAMMFNLIPDFVSLWETRVITRWVSARRRSLLTLLLVDLLFTAVVSGASIGGVQLLVSVGDGWTLQVHWEEIAASAYGVVTLAPIGFGRIPTVITADRPADLNFDSSDVDAYQEQWETDFEAGLVPFFHLWPNRYGPEGVFELAQAGEFDREESEEYLPLGIFFYSAFATSVWLWLHAAAVLLSRALLRMNSGVGFLLRVTDVERQPFRSMGFVSVIIVSVLFALGLPLVLL